MKNGILYPIVNRLMFWLRLLSLAEWVKGAGRLLFARDLPEGERREIDRISVDVFIAIKFSLILALIWTGATAEIWAPLVWYLLIANLHSYTFYHLWSAEVQEGSTFNTDRVKRRFMTLMFAITFSLLGFAYLYMVPYSSEFHWESGSANIRDALMLSTRTSLIAGYGQVSELTATAHVLTTVQLMTMFFFLTIILSNSVPQTHTDTPENINGI